MIEPLSSLRLVYQKPTQADIEPLAKRISSRLNEIGVTDHSLIHYVVRPGVPYRYGIHIAFRKYPPRQLVEMLQQQSALEVGEDLAYFNKQYSSEDELQDALEDMVMTLLTREVYDKDTELELSTPEYFGQAVSSQEWVIAKVERFGTYADDPADDATFLRKVYENSDYQ